MNDKEKLSVFRGIKTGKPTEEIIEEMRISENTLITLHKEYDAIKHDIELLNSIEELSKKSEYSIDYLEKVKHIIETDSEKLIEEMETDGLVPFIKPQEEELKTTPEKPKKYLKPGKGGKGGKGAKESPKNIEETIESSGEGETAEILIKDAVDIAKTMAIERHEIGKHAMESYSTTAAQYGYTDLMQFMDQMFNFWTENQGKIKEMEEIIEEYEEIITQLKEVVDTDITQVFISQSIDRVLVAALMGGGSIDVESLQAYREFLISDPNTRNKLKKLVGQYNNTNDVNKPESNTVLNML